MKNKTNYLLLYVSAILLFSLNITAKELVLSCILGNSNNSLTGYSSYELSDFNQSRHSGYLIFKTTKDLSIELYQDGVIVNTSSYPYDQLMSYSSEDLKADTFMDKYLKLDRSLVSYAKDLVFPDKTLLVNYFDRNDQFLGGAIILGGSQIQICENPNLSIR